MATHSSRLAWRALWTEGPGGVWPMGSQKSQIQLKGLSTAHIGICKDRYKTNHCVRLLE